MPGRKGKAEPKGPASEPATSGDVAQAILKRALSEHPRAPAAWRHVATALATHHDARAAWRVLGSDEATVLRVTSMVRQAYEAAELEARRPPPKIESEDVERVIKLAKDLQRALLLSTLPGNTASIGQLELHADGRPPVEIEFGWHSLPAGGHGFGYPLSLDDVLNLAIDMAGQHLRSLPTRAADRIKEQPRVLIFVRHLAWQFHREFGGERHGTIGRLAAAVYDLPAALDEKAVASRLKGRPSNLTPRSSG